MPAVADDPLVKKHWVVAGYGLATDTATLGTFGAVDGQLYGDVETAKTRAKTLAAQTPGTYYVVYEAMWYAYTDITPVTLRRVGLAAVG
jgi:hypothetical protein